MYRIYDLDNKSWVNSDVYLVPNTYNDYYVLEKGIFGKKKLKLISDDRFVFHNDIGMFDKNEKVVFEGDFIKAIVENDEVVVGMVVYAHELASYILWCDKIEKWFELGTDIENRIEVIGNVFDGCKEVNQDGQQAL